MWQFNIVDTPTTDSSGNVSLSVEYLKDGSPVLTRQHNISSMEGLKLQVMSIQEQYDSSLELIAELQSADTSAIQTEVESLKQDKG